MRAEVPDTPSLDRVEAAGNRILISWSAAAQQDYVVTEARQQDFSDEQTVFEGKGSTALLFGRPPGDYFYRLRTVSGGVWSGWSAGVALRTGEATGMVLDSSYSDQALLDVQRCLLRLCAARADLFAVLNLPSHYDEEAGLEHVSKLKSPSRLAPANGEQKIVFGISDRESSAFSYGAIYHPWVNDREGVDGRLRLSPPDGMICGSLAKRALARGAWIAPANEPLQGILDLKPRLAQDRFLDLLTAQLNVIRREPRGFLLLSEDTLSDEQDLRPVHVRRLLSLLRRVATRLGNRYVFEPHDAPFRRLVQRNLEAVMDLLFERGAFAGRTRQESFQVVIDDGPTSLTSIERGRLLCELRVAPAQALSFLTIRLVETGDRGVVTEVR